VNHLGAAAAAVNIHPCYVLYIAIIFSFTTCSKLYRVFNNKIVVEFATVSIM
ncbi:hypothetical protein ACJX0J_021666, partial [Zea mays]